ncbi:MAG: PQQ-binding-like beta-propeller repeat protein [Verrucomicrobiota bacterium]
MKLAYLLSCLALTSMTFADWPQWRGPERNGKAAAGLKIPVISEDAPPAKLWESTSVPSDHDGGHGSVSVAKGKVYLSVVWHRDVPTEKRQFTRKFLSDIGHRGTTGVPAEIVEKMEHDRMNLSRRLRGKELDDYANQWVDDHIDEKTKLALGSWIASRFKKGKAALPISAMEEVAAMSDHVFANQAELDAWFAERDWDDAVRDEIADKVLKTEKQANDVVLALDAETGEEAWRFEVEGFPSGRSSSSTPAVFDGKVYAALSLNLYCIDAATGEEIWQAPLTGKKGPASSPLITEGRVFLHENRLTCFDATTGAELWQNKQVKGSNSSPAIWGNLILSNSSKELVAADIETGETLWAIPGGGDATPVVSGDYLILMSRFEKSNLSVYQLSADGPEELWNHRYLARRYSASPIVHEGHVYHLGSSMHVCFDIESGEKKWERPAQSQISSPVFVDGKLLVYENKGGMLGMVEARADDYHHMGKAKVGALPCASPAIAGGKIFMRTKESVVCFQLGE